MTTKRFCVICVALALFATSLFGQTSKASVSGIVSDPSGAVLNRATVMVKDLDRGTVYTNWLRTELLLRR